MTWEQKVVGVIEKSQSKTGKHAVYSNFFIVSRSGDVKEAVPDRKRQVKPTYAKGSAIEANIHPPLTEDRVLVYMKFVKNLRGRVKGKIIVYDQKGNRALMVNYSKLKIRRSKGDKNFSWAIKYLLDHLKIPVKRYNFETGEP